MWILLYYHIKYSVVSNSYTYTQTKSTDDSDIEAMLATIRLLLNAQLNHGKDPKFDWCGILYASMCLKWKMHVIDDFIWVSQCY